MGCNNSHTKTNAPKDTSGQDSSTASLPVVPGQHCSERPAVLDHSDNIQIIKPTDTQIEQSKPEQEPNLYFEACVELMGQTNAVRRKCHHPINIVELGDGGDKIIDDTRPTTSLEFVSFGPGNLVLTLCDENNCPKQTYDLFFEESSVIVLQHFIKKSKAYIVIYISSASAQYAKYAIFEARPAHRAFTAMFISISIALSIALSGRVSNQLATSIASSTQFGTNSDDKSELTG
jgi:hypothetical protein